MTLGGGAPLAEGEPVAAVFRPSAVHLERAMDESWTGALRLAQQGAATPGEWLTRVTRLEQTPVGVRVHTAGLDVAVDVPADAVAAMGLTAGDPVRLRVAADDVALHPAAI